LCTRASTATVAPPQTAPAPRSQTQPASAPRPQTPDAAPPPSPPPPPRSQPPPSKNRDVLSRSNACSLRIEVSCIIPIPHVAPPFAQTSTAGIYFHEAIWLEIPKCAEQERHDRFNCFELVVF